MQLAMKNKVIAAAMAAALCLCVAPALAMATPAKAHAAGKTNINECDITVETEKYVAKTDKWKDLAAYKGGKAVKPKVVVTYYEPGRYDEATGTHIEGKIITLKKGKDYTVTYKNNKKVGTAMAIVKGKGAYKGKSIETFSISPKVTKVTKVKGAKKALTVSWKKLSAAQADGYRVDVYTRGDKYVTTIDGKKYTRYHYTFVKSALVKDYKKTSTTIKGLKAKTKYYVTVAPYKMASGTYNAITPVWNDKGDKIIRRVTVTNPYAGVYWGNTSDYKAGKTK